jgi:hypothetical protein
MKNLSVDVLAVTHSGHLPDTNRNSYRSGNRVPGVLTRQELITRSLVGPDVSREWERYISQA